jgi:hypothetical protein
MSFYLEVSDRKLKFGGLKSISADWGYISQSAGRTFKEPDGNICSPIGMWVIGSAMKTNYVLTKLRLCNNWTEDELLMLAGENDVMIGVATDKRFYLYRNSARMFYDYDEGSYRWLKGCSESQFEGAVSGRNVPQYWTTDETNYF